MPGTAMLDSQQLARLLYETAYRSTRLKRFNGWIRSPTHMKYSSSNHAKYSSGITILWSQNVI